MAISNKRVTVTTSPTALNDKDLDGAHLHIRGDADFYIGNENVTDANGFLIDKDTITKVFVGPDEVLYGIVTRGRTVVYQLMTLNQ